jgi:drug/metabolite transporter, DME family
LIGVAYAATVILFVLANKLTTSANAIFLQSTAPLYLLLLGPLVLREPVRALDLAIISGIAAGTVLLVSGAPPASGTAPDPHRGNLLALAAGAAWALTLTGLRWMGKHSQDPGSGTATVIAGNLIAFLVALPIILIPPHAAAPVRAADLAVLAWLGIFQISLAYIFLTRSLRVVPGLEASMLLLVEPVFNPIWTWLLHGESPGAPALFGGLLIIGAAFCSLRFANYSK